MVIVLKLSGEGLSSGGEVYSPNTLSLIADQIGALLSKGNKVSLVVGGGNIFRGQDLAGRLSIERPTADYMGMLATVQNALVLRDYFESRSIPTRVMSALSMPQVCEMYIQKRAFRHMEKGRVVIFAGGLGSPYFTTDTTAVQRALEIKAELLVMAKNNVDGVYTGDPKQDKSATKIDRITCSEVLERNLRVADSAAIALAKEYKLPIRVVGVKDISAVMDSEVGTDIKPY